MIIDGIPIGKMDFDEIEALVKAGALCGCCQELIDIGFIGDSVGDKIWCSDCFWEEYEHVCIVCEHRVLKATVGNKGDLFILAEERDGLKAGLYQIINLPYYGDDMLSQWLWRDAVKLIDENTFGVEADGLLCQDCKVELLGVGDG